MGRSSRRPPASRSSPSGNAALASTSHPCGLPASWLRWSRKPTNSCGYWIREPERALCSPLSLHTVCGRVARHRDLTVTAYEIDEEFQPFLNRSANVVASACASRSIPCEVNLRFEDFAELSSLEGLGHLFSEPETFDAAILNPPYGKLSSDSDLRARLDALGIAAPNLYAAFLGLALRVVRPGGTVVAIVPRSFCNGTYFGRFRRYLLRAASVRHVHLFARRDKAFGEDAVLPGERCSGIAEGNRAARLRFAFVQRGRRGRSRLEPEDQDHRRSSAKPMPICSCTFPTATGASGFPAPWIRCHPTCVEWGSAYPPVPWWVSACDGGSRNRTVSTRPPLCCTPPISEK